MPKKTRRIKALQHKRKQLRQNLPAKAVPQPAVAQVQPSAATAGASAPPSTKLSPSRAALKVVPYTNVVAELKSIGILAGIILVILVILALVLP